MMHHRGQIPLGAESPCDCERRPEENFLQRYDVVPAVVTGVIVAVATGVVLYQLQRLGVKTA